MAAAEIGGGRGEESLVGVAGADGLLEGVVDLKDGFLRAVEAAVLGFVFALHDGEVVHDVGNGIAGRGEGAGGKTEIAEITPSSLIRVVP